MQANKQPLGLIPAACLLLAMSLCLSTQAETRDAAGLPHYIPLQKHGAYDVEVLVFSRGHAQASTPLADTEWLTLDDTTYLEPRPADLPEWRWPAPHQTDNQTNWTMPVEEHKPQVLVNYQRNDLYLTKTAAKLASQPGWRVLLHKKWRLQPSPFKQPRYLNLSTTSIPHTAPAAEFFGQSSGLSPGAEITPGLLGKLAFSKGRYLHVEARLQQIDTGPDGQPQVTTLTEKRRVRSQILHYFDHPDFGLLVWITPVQAPPPPETPAGQPDNGGPKA